MQTFIKLFALVVVMPGSFSVPLAGAYAIGQSLFPATDVVFSEDEVPVIVGSLTSQNIVFDEVTVIVDHG